MFYTTLQRIDIGRKVFTHEMTKSEASKEFMVSEQSIVNYVKEYMKANKIPVIPDVDNVLDIKTPNYSEMTKDQLIVEIMKKDIEVARAKKGYTVKGGGKTKGFSSIKDANTK